MAMKFIATFVNCTFNSRVCWLERKVGEKLEELQHNDSGGVCSKPLQVSACAVRSALRQGQQTIPMDGFSWSDSNKAMLESPRGLYLSLASCSFVMQ